jgi:hypothetical protein
MAGVQWIYCQKFGHLMKFLGKGDAVLGSRKEHRHRRGHLGIKNFLTGRAGLLTVTSYLRQATGSMREKKPEQAEPATITESLERAQAQANLERALDAMARLRRTIDSRPSGLTQPGNRDRLLKFLKTCLYEARGIEE